MDITADTLIELMRSAIDARQDTEARMLELTRQVEELEKSRALLLQEEQGYRLAIARRFPAEELESAVASESGAESDAVLFPMTDEIVNQQRSDAVESAIRSITRNEPSASPSAIEEFLRKRGRDDSREAISAAIAYLNRKDRVVNVSRGQWKLAEAQ